MQSNKFVRVYKSIMLILLTATITFIITSTVINTKNSQKTSAKSVSTDTYSRVFQTFHKYLSEKYLYDLNENEMLESAIKGYVAGLGDEYSEYITADEMKKYMQDTIGKYVGIGVYLANDKENNQVVILTPLKGSPAEEAGIKPGDVILKVDGVSYTGEQLTECSNALKKEEGTIAEVELLREGDTITLNIERKSIKVHHVQTTMLEDNIGYVYISSFDEGTYDEFMEDWEELKARNVKSLIIDIRGNGGGIVPEALNIADLMVEKDKTLLITNGKKEGEKPTKSTKDKEIDIPVVILMDKSTASSSEILAAAVRENNENVKLIGKTTYGKGIIQTIFTLSDGSGLKLTTDEYFTPNHNSINKVGIKPDIEVELPEGESIYTVSLEEDTQLQKAIEILK